MEEQHRRRLQREGEEEELSHCIKKKSLSEQGAQEEQAQIFRSVQGFSQACSDTPPSTFGSGRSSGGDGWGSRRPVTAPTQILFTSSSPRSSTQRWSTIPKTYGAALAVLQETARDFGVKAGGFAVPTHSHHVRHHDGSWKEALRSPA